MREPSEFFKTLGDETRLKILWLLMNKKELCVCDVMEVLQITQSKASRHLKTLYHAGLVNHRRQGQWMYYALCKFAGKPGDELIKGQLRALKKALAPRPDSAELLEALQQWMERKERGEQCRTSTRTRTPATVMPA